MSCALSNKWPGIKGVRNRLICIQSCSTHSTRKMNSSSYLLLLVVLFACVFGANAQWSGYQFQQPSWV